MPSNSENRFGLVVDKFSELGHIWILNRGDGYQVIITLAQQSEILLRLFLLWHSEIKISKQISNFLKRIQWEFLKNNWTWILDCRVSCSLKIFTGCNKVLKHSIWKSFHFLLCFNPLYLSYVFICSTLYSHGSLSYFETGMLLKMLQGQAELIANCVFAYSALASFCKNGPYLSR